MLDDVVSECFTHIKITTTTVELSFAKVRYFFVHSEQSVVRCHAGTSCERKVPSVWWPVLTKHCD